MTSRVRKITIDCSDAYSLASSWDGVHGGTLGADDRPGEHEALVTSDGGSLLFLAVPERKTVKNRVHLDLQPQDRGRDAEVERVLALGATLVADLREPDGTGWVVLADPEGNELCIERSAAERAG